MKRKLLVILLSIIMLGGAGCVRSDTPGAADWAAYLSEKYTDDTFTYSSSYRGAPSSSVKTMFFESASYPGRLITATYNSESGKYYENYLSAKYYDETCSMANDIVLGVFAPDACVYYTDTFRDGVSPEDATQDTTFEEFISDPGALLSLTIVADPSRLSGTPDEAVELLKEKVIESGACLTSVKLFFTEEYDLSGGLARSEYEYMRSEKLYSGYYLLTMEESGSFSAERQVK